MKWSAFLPYLAVTAGVTYLIRMLPMTVFRKEIKSRFIRSFRFRFFRSRSFRFFGISFQLCIKIVDLRTAVGPAYHPCCRHADDERQYEQHENQMYQKLYQFLYHASCLLRPRSMIRPFMKRRFKERLRSLLRDTSTSCLSRSLSGANRPEDGSCPDMRCPDTPLGVRAT